MDSTWQIKKYGLPVVVAGFLSGVALRSFLFAGIGIYVALAAALCGLALAVIYVFRARTIIILSVLLCASLAVGLLRFEEVDRYAPPEILRSSVGQEITLTGAIVDEVIKKRDYQRVVVHPSQVNQEEIDTDLRILIFARHFPQLAYGDMLRVTGELTRPESFQTDTGREFPYPEYLKKDGLYFQVFYPKISRLGSGGGSFIKRWLFALKRAFLSSIQEVVPEPHAALLGGVTVGAEEALGEALEEKFRTTGLIHIVVLSGFNVTIVAEAIMRLVGFLSLGIRALFGSTSIVLFALLTGASATIVRASIMAILVIIARAFGRPYQIIRALFLAAALMVMVNPYILRFDPSFQLSFLASLGLIYAGPWVEQMFSAVPRMFQLREYATATAATQLFVTPLLIYMTGEISLVSLPVNLLSLPLIPVSMLLGFVTSIAGWLSTSFAQPIGLAAYASADYVFRIVDFFAALPFSSVAIPTIPGWAVVVCYMVLGVIIWRWGKPKEATDHV